MSDCYFAWIIFLKILFTDDQEGHLVCRKSPGGPVKRGREFQREVTSNGDSKNSRVGTPDEAMGRHLSPVAPFQWRKWRFIGDLLVTHDNNGAN